MTSRHLVLTPSLILCCQGLFVASGPLAHAQGAPALSPASAVASHITPARRTAPPHFERRVLVVAPPSKEATPAPAVATPAPAVAPPKPEVVQTTPGTAKSVIAAPVPANPRVATPFAPAASKPTAVPFVAAPGAPPVLPAISARPKVGTTVAQAPPAPSAAAIPAPKPVVAVNPAKPAPATAKETEDEKADRLLLARLESDLDEASRRLDRAKSKISDGERQLSSFTDVLQRAMMEAGPDSRGLNPFVRVAQRYRGTPYVWGGVSARGFDCSGFIIRVMRDLGYRALPHSAAEQFRYGLPIAEQLLKPGDLVFFANTYKPGISHVGIYLGRRRFIHAANSQVGTIVSSLDEAKWSAKYAGGRRLIPVTS